MDAKVKIIIILMMVPIVFSQINITKTAPHESPLNKTIVIDIHIINNEDYTENLSVYEYPGDIIPINPNKLIIENTSGCAFCVVPPYFLWNISINPKSNKTITYKIKPKVIGDLIISPTVAYDQNGNTFHSNPVTIKVLCNLNGVCEPDIGENYFNCRDCPSGSKDNVCDLVEDGICDPDCEPGYDDCICNNNGKCESWENESCPDCQKKENKKTNYTLYILFLLFVILLIFILYWIYIFIKSRKEKEIIRRVEDGR